jgi:serine/threonine protein kinase, bacterial
LSKREKSWDEGLSIHQDTKAILKRLLQIDEEYQDASELMKELTGVIHRLQAR